MGRSLSLSQRRTFPPDAVGPAAAARRQPFGRGDDGPRADGPRNKSNTTHPRQHHDIIIRTIGLSELVRMGIIFLGLCSLLGARKSVTTVVVVHQPRDQQYEHRASNSTPFHDTRNTASRTVFYMPMRRDRTGASIQEMLLAHAYAFRSNDHVVYGGVCLDAKHEGDVDADAEKQRQLAELIRALNLQDVLRFACPPKQPTTTTTNTSHVLISRHDLLRAISFSRNFDNNSNNGHSHENNLLTDPAWLAQIRSLVHQRRPQPRQQKAGLRRGNDTATPAAPQHTTLQVAVHVRRGDVSPCDKRTAFRYTPNAYYLDVIKKYVMAPLRQKQRRQRSWFFSSSNENSTSNHDSLVDVNVTIYSEHTHDAVESWDAYLAQNYSLALGTDLVTTWRAFLDADILITSKSSFSYVPALLRQQPSLLQQRQLQHQAEDADTSLPNHSVLYQPFWYEPITDAEWTVVDVDIVDAIRYDMIRLQRTHCPSMLLSAAAAAVSPSAADKIKIT